MSKRSLHLPKSPNAKAKCNCMYHLKLAKKKSNVGSSNSNNWNTQTRIFQKSPNKENKPTIVNAAPVCSSNKSNILKHFDLNQNITSDKNVKTITTQEGANSKNDSSVSPETGLNFQPGNKETNIIISGNVQNHDKCQNYQTDNVESNVHASYACQTKETSQEQQPNGGRNSEGSEEPQNEENNQQQLEADSIKLQDHGGHQENNKTSQSPNIVTTFIDHEVCQLGQNIGQHQIENTGSEFLSDENAQHHQIEENKEPHPAEKVKSNLLNPENRQFQENKQPQLCNKETFWILAKWAIFLFLFLIYEGQFILYLTLLVALLYVITCTLWPTLDESTMKELNFTPSCNDLQIKQMSPIPNSNQGHEIICNILELTTPPKTI